MTDNEMRAFLQQITDKMNTNFHIDMINSFADALKAMAENANAVLKSINLDALRCTLLVISDVLSSLSKDVKETAFFQKVDKFAKDDKHSLTYKKIEWFLEDIRNEVLIGAPDINSQTELTKYIAQIEEDLALGIREKITVLLAHIEPLIYETLNHEKPPRESVKNKVQEIAVANNKGMSAESLAKAYVYGICSIVFANTDSFDIPIDKKLPFRNNILHNGIVSYSEEDLKTVYEVLADFMDALVVMKKWIPVKDDNEPTGQENLQ